MPAAAAVAVAGGAGSLRAACWAAANVSGSVVLLHVIPPLAFVPSPSGDMVAVESVDAEVAEMYAEDRRAAAAGRAFSDIIPVFRGKKGVESVVLEGVDVAAVLVKYVMECGIRSLILGSSTFGWLKRIFNYRDVPNAILKLVTYSGNVYIISRRTVTFKCASQPLNGGSFVKAEVQRIGLKEFAMKRGIWDAGRQPLLNPISQSSSMSIVRTTGNVEPSKENASDKHLEYVNELLPVNYTEETEKANEVLLSEVPLQLVENEGKEEHSKISNSLMHTSKSCRRYSVDEIKRATNNFSDLQKIGEGSYGNVYKCILDHTDVAIKVIRQGSEEKDEEFLREVEILGQLHHPNLVLLLGYCPENGSLVYEYMNNGSLQDLFKKQGASLPWFIRLRIIFEVALGLAFLHGTKPEPIVHRDLKPGNILLDSHYMAKIGDVGLAKLIAEVVPDGLTEYKETILAGTLYYMDPEYQRTGTVRPKSDLYALGVVMLQLLTSKPPNGLLFSVETAIKSGSFADILDKSSADWPISEAEKLAKLALRCTKLRCRDRPDLEAEVLPELEELLSAASSISNMKRSSVAVPSHFLCPISKAIMNDPYVAADGHAYEHGAIKEWLENNDISPVTRKRLTHKTVTPDHTLRAAILKWKSESATLNL